MGEGKEISINTEMGTLAAIAWGNPTQKPLLAVHGWLDNAASFSHLAPLLASKFYVVAVDLPGHGLSPHAPNGRSYLYIDWVLTLHQIVSALEWKSFSLLGHSLGGGIVSLFAGAFPQKVEHLISLEAMGPITAPGEEAAIRFREYFRQKEIQKHKTPPKYKSVEEACKHRLTATSMLQKSVETLCKRGLVELDGHLVWRTDPRLKLPSYSRLTEEQTKAFMIEISAPTLVVIASETELPEFFVNLRGSYLRNKTIRRLNGKHHFHLDDPEAVSGEILGWISSLHSR